jgi:hypothetical protein
MNKLMRITMLSIFALSFGYTAIGHAEEAVTGEMVHVQQCPHCGFTVADKCPMCDAVMEKKTMSASDAQAAIDKTKDMIRRR